MHFAKYVTYWIILSAILTFEYFAIKFMPGYSIIGVFSKISGISFEISTASGRPIGHFFGWTGFGLILITNFYIIRKRSAFLQKFGTSVGWLNFHMFCGLAGPTFIVFHSDFKVRGLVGVSFWSMIIIAVSGIVGRYFYLQVASQTSELEGDSDKWLKKFDEITGKSPIESTQKEKIISSALKFVGVPKSLQEEKGGLALSIFFSSLAGDMRLHWYPIPLIAGHGEGASKVILQYALARRKVLFWEPFQNLFGYWHAFHLPFAFFMYIAAIIHIISSTLFKVH